VIKVRGNILISLIIGLVVLVAGLVFTVGASATFNPPQFTLCHIPPGNPDNPQTITVGFAGYLNHLQNHELDYAGECQEPEPEDVCDNLEGVQEETPEGYINDDGYCYIPELEDVCPNLDGIQEKLPEGYHFEYFGNNHEYEEAICVPDEQPETPPTPRSEPPQSQPSAPEYHSKQCPDGNNPAAPIAFAGEQSRVDDDTVLLKWRKSTDWQDTAKQSLIYGYSPDQLVYGIDNLPKDAESTHVNEVQNRHIWFQVIAEKGNGCNSRSEIVDP